MGPPLPRAPRLEAFSGFLWGRAYIFAALILFPVHILLALILRARVRPRSVVHIGELRHLQYHLVQALKDRGFQATYLAVGENPHWSECDVHLPHLRNPLAAVLRDSWVFWAVVARHEIVHCHAMMGVSHYQWEFPLLKIMGRKVVAHFRGCEARDRRKNISLHPQVNICQDCDYAPNYLCANRETRRRRWVARRLADAILVTTPDLKDFWPGAEHLPFLLPPDLPERQARPNGSGLEGRAFRIIHATNQPGIEGTEEIKRVIARLRDKGYDVEFIHLTDVPHDRVLAELADADIAVGKLKMGYYANAQAESMAMGVPTVTWVRPDLKGEGLDDGGFILASLDDLEGALENAITDPEFLRRHREDAAATIRKLHDTDAIIEKLTTIYGWREGGSRGECASA